MELIRADAGWKKEILRFADEVFGTDLPPGGFARLIPDVYGPDAPCDGNHWLTLNDSSGGKGNPSARARGPAFPQQSKERCFRNRPPVVREEKKCPRGRFIAVIHRRPPLSNEKYRGELYLF